MKQVDRTVDPAEKGKNRCRKKSTAVVLGLFLLCCLLFSACGQGGGHLPEEKPDEKTENNNTEQQAGDSSDDVTEDVSRTEEDKMREVREMDREEILTFVEEASGLSFGDSISDASGVTYDELYYVRLYIAEGKESEAEELLTGLCGSGYDPYTRTIPKAKNRICDELNAVGPTWAYTYMGPGRGGAKTATTSFYKAVENGVTSIFVFGYR